MTDLPVDLANLLVTEIGEYAENCLRVVIAEGMLGLLEPIKWNDVDLGEGRPIEINHQSRRFELKWDNYVAYAVRNESYWKAEIDNLPIFFTFERRAQSAFLDFVSQTTFADDSYPGPLIHWALNTLTHCIDVVSAHPPLIRQLKNVRWRKPWDRVN